MNNLSTNVTDVNHRLSIGDADDIFGQISNGMYSD